MRPLWCLECQENKPVSAVMRGEYITPTFSLAVVVIRLLNYDPDGSNVETMYGRVDQ